MARSNSPYALAVALCKLHNFDYDIAFLSAWYYLHGCRPTATPYQVLARMEMVKNIPIVSEKEAQTMLDCYSKSKMGFYD